MSPPNEDNRRSDITEVISLETNEIIESDEGSNVNKTKVECICPMCNQKHIMNIYWIGRGIPRKYCQNCKGSL